MEEPGQAVQAIHQSSTRRECDEAALVLRAVGISCQMVRTGRQYVLLVATSDAEQAAAELEAYAGERREDRVPRVEPAPLRPPGRAWKGVVAYAAVLVIVAVMQDGHAFSSDWVEAGKTNAGLIREGHWWRTVTALTLHASLVHLAGNLFFGALFGLFAGRMLGPGMAWACILLTGALGNGLNALIQPATHSSIGASTAVFGALGILAAAAWKQRRRVEGSWIRRGVPILGGVVLLAYTGFGGERTDVLAHVTGFAAGLLLALLLRSDAQRPVEKPRAQLAFGVAAVALLVFCWWVTLSVEV